MNSSRRRDLLFSLVLVVLLLAMVEGLAFVAGRVLLEWNVLYGPEPADYRAYLAKRDPVLGWPSPSEFGGRRFDASGARPSPAFPEPGRACVSLYGDSMTYGSEVDDEHAWGNVLARQLGCRVANYGVGGYGTDQALLRFRQNADDEAGIVVLGHLSVNAQRNVNQFRGLLSNNATGLKPRFLLADDGGLELVPIPAIAPEHYADFLRDPLPDLPHEHFRAYGLPFPYLPSLVRALGHFKLRAAWTGRPAHAAFYEDAHPSHALELTARIAEAFDAEARARGQAPLVVVIPIGSDFEHRLETGDWVYAPLLERLRAGGVEPVDAGAAMLARLPSGSHPCEAWFDDCSGHFDEAGYALLAEVVRDALRDRGLEPHTRAPAAAEPSGGP